MVFSFTIVSILTLMENLDLTYSLITNTFISMKHIQVRTIKVNWNVLVCMEHPLTLLGPHPRHRVTWSHDIFSLLSLHMLLFSFLLMTLLIMKITTQISSQHQSIDIYNFWVFRDWSKAVELEHANNSALSCHSIKECKLSGLPL